MSKRTIVVKLGDEETSFGFARVDRSKLYGRKERVILDENGERCVPAYLTPDGAALVPPGGTAHIYVDEDFNYVDRKALQAVDDEGDTLTPIASTLGVAQELTPARPERLLDQLVTSVYELNAESLGAALSSSLADGDIFECAFQYREGYGAELLFLLQNDEGVFGLVTRPSGFEWIRREAPVTEPPEDEDDDEDGLGDDFDFSMM
ncbi:MAG TPA: hypothetical protein ENK57_17700 [Polyangiaceae bacterium]|nr:hypothetical protein [Polyangiaceae bacterium]